MSKQETVKQKGSLNFSHYQKNQKLHYESNNKKKNKILRSLTKIEKTNVNKKSYILAMIQELDEILMFQI